jgi:hypothetical protein
MKKLIRIVLGGILLLVLTVGLVQIYTSQAGEVNRGQLPQEGWPDMQAAVKATPGEAEAIKAIIAQSRLVDEYAAINFDNSRYETVYIDDPAVALSKNQAEYLQEIRGKLGASYKGKGNGWLSYCIATLQNWKNGSEAIEKAQAKAQAENRSVQATDFNDVSNVVGVPASWPDPNRKIVQAKDIKFDFQEIKLKGNYALATYDDGVSLLQTFLVQTQGGWKIAGIRNIQVHG